MDSQNNK